MCTLIPKKYAIMNTLPTNVLYDIYCPKSDGSVILLGWSSINARQMLSVSRATIVLPCMGMTEKSESLSVVIVDLSQVWSLRRQENDLPASMLPIGKTARIFSSVDGGAKTKSYKQYVEIEIARRRNGRVDRPGLDDDDATSLKHRNEAFLDYMLDSVFVGSK